MALKLFEFLELLEQLELVDIRKLYKKNFEKKFMKNMKRENKKLILNFKSLRNLKIENEFGTIKFILKKMYLCTRSMYRSVMRNSIESKL